MREKALCQHLHSGTFLFTNKQIEKVLVLNQCLIQSPARSLGTCIEGAGGAVLSLPSPSSHSHATIWGGVGGIFQWNKLPAATKNASPSPVHACPHVVKSRDPLSLGAPELRGS